MIFSALIEGVILDIITEEPVPFAHVKCEDKETNADIEGKFKLEVKPGEHLMTVIAPGYKKLRKKVKAPCKIKLYIEPGRLARIVVRSRKEKATPSTIKMNSKDFEESSTTFLEDPLRQVQAMPGVGKFLDLGSSLFIRGGSAHESGVFLDGSPLRYAFHWKGGGSVFDSDMLKSGTLYLGAWPARYGGFLSGIFWAEGKEIDRKSFEISVSGADANLLFSTAVKRFSVFTMARTSYIEHLIKIFMPPCYKEAIYLLPRMFDVYSKISYKHKNTSFYISTLYSWDWAKWEFGTGITEEAGIPEGSAFEHGGESISVFSGYSGLFQLNLSYQRVTKKNIFHYLSKEWPYTQEWNLLTWRIEKFHKIAGIGTDGIYYIKALFPEKDRRVNPSFYSAYIWLEGGKKLEYNLGSRFTYFETCKKIYALPKGALQLNIKNFRLRIASGVYAQILPDPISLPDNFKPEMCTHYIAEIEYARYPLKFRLTGFYKLYTNLFYNQKNSGKGTARGFEILLQKDSGWINGWISYTYLDSFRIFDGWEYRPPQDRTHSVDIVLKIKPLSWIKLTNEISASSGAPTFPVLNTATIVDPDWYYSPPKEEQERLPPVFKWDLKAEFFRNPGLYIQIINLTSHKNVEAYVYSNGKKIEAYGFPFMAYLGIKWGW